MFEPFKLLDITAMSDETLTEHGYAAVMELLVKHIRQREIIPVIQRIRELPLFAQIFDIGAGEYRKIVLRYITDKGETENKGQVIELLTDPSIDAGDEIMTIAEQWKQEGKQENAEAIAKRLLAMRVLSSEKIAEATGLSAGEVEVLEAANH
ncbi:MAG: Rpn family recombination-promoting nuclease/putative transposase [Gammaproteobacteria bacterium]|nr:Rpn family recombination-promoting nuclease/putative transposase [Gammaproteobacteria bacterium]